MPSQPYFAAVTDPLVAPLDGGFSQEQVTVSVTSIPTVTATADVGDFVIAGSNRFFGNNRTLDGDLTMGPGDDRAYFRNAVVTGDIDTGQGNDILDLRGATVGGTITGGGGNDRFIVNESSPTFNGGGGQDSVWSYGSHTLAPGLENLRLMEGGDHNGTGNAASNRIYGNDGDNVLAGRGGRDKLYGHDGDDTLRDGSGRDFLYGGSGADRFILVLDRDRDWVKDFELGQDTIDLSAWGAASASDLFVRVRDAERIELRFDGDSLFVESAAGALSTDDLFDSLIFA